MHRHSVLALTCSNSIYGFSAAFRHIITVLKSCFMMNMKSFCPRMWNCGVAMWKRLGQLIFFTY